MNLPGTFIPPVDASRMNLVVDVQGNLVVGAAVGRTKYTIVPSTSEITLTTFRNDFDELDLSHFSHIHSLEDVKARSSVRSVTPVPSFSLLSTFSHSLSSTDVTGKELLVIKLTKKQSLVLLSHTTMDLTAQSFSFSTSKPSTTTGSAAIAGIGSVPALAVFTVVMFILLFSLFILIKGKYYLDDDDSHETAEKSSEIKAALKHDNKKKSSSLADKRKLEGKESEEDQFLLGANYIPKKPLDLDIRVNTSNPEDDQDVEANHLPHSLYRQQLPEEEEEDSPLQIQIIPSGRRLVVDEIEEDGEEDCDDDDTDDSDDFDDVFSEELFSDELEEEGKEDSFKKNNNQLVFLKNLSKDGKESDEGSDESSRSLLSLGSDLDNENEDGSNDSAHSLSFQQEELPDSDEEEEEEGSDSSSDDN